MDRQQMLKVLVPVGGLAVLFVVVGLVVALAGGGETPDSGTQASTPSVTPGEGKPLPQNINRRPNPPVDAPAMTFPLDGPEWKDVGRGLKIWDVVEGTGAVCPDLSERPGLVPIMHYTGWLTNGTMFDSSLPRGQPLDMALAQLIAGWQRGVPGMKVGGKRRLLIPSDLGYGPRGQGQIPPNATLVFEMELLDIK